MPTIFTGQGSVVSTTSGNARRVAVTNVANTTPIQVTAAGHAFLQTDTILIEGTGIAAIDGNYYQVNIISSSVVSLLGTNASGTSTTGYMIDYQMQPATQIPAGSELADPNTFGAAIQSVANYAPFLNARTGKWRLYNEYTFLAGTPLSTPWISNAWSTQSGLNSPGSFTAFQNGQFSLQSLSDYTPPSYSITNEYFVFNLSFSMLMLMNGNNVQCSVGVGAQIQSGTGINMLGMPFVVVSLPAIGQSSTEMVWPITLSGAFQGGFGASNLYLTLTYRIDSIPAGTLTLNLIGQASGTILQYRGN